MDYQLKPIPVKIARWPNDGDHPDVHITTKFYPPNFDEEDCSHTFDVYKFTSDGEQTANDIPIVQGQWVVDYPDGTIEVLSSEKELNDKFEKI